MIEMLREDFFFEKIIQLDTPAVIYNLDYIQALIKRIRNDISNNVKDKDRVNLYFSCKANSNPKILVFLNDYIDGFDVASEYEYKKIKDICGKTTNISYTSPFIHKEMLQEVYSDGNLFDFNSINQLTNHADLVTNKEIGLRINMDLKDANETIFGNISRFGTNYSDKRLETLIKHNGLRIKKIHIHTGEKSVSIIKDILKHIENILSGPLFGDVDTVNIGGGLLNIYRNRDTIKQFWLIIDDFLTKHPTINIIIEPGSLIVAFSGYLISSIVDCDFTEDEKIANITLDTSRHNLFTWNKPNLIFPKRVESEKGIKCNINGCTCYELDFFVKDVFLDKKNLTLQQKFIFGPVGAYVKANSKSLHDYPFPNEYYFNKGNIESSEIENEC